MAELQHQRPLESAFAERLAALAEALDRRQPLLRGELHRDGPAVAARRSRRR